MKRILSTELDLTVHSGNEGCLPFPPRRQRQPRLLFVAAFAVAVIHAQTAASPAGHWEGAIQTPNGDLQVEIDLAQETGKGWIGTISIPAQRTKGLALTDVAVKESTVTFGIKAPGDPKWQGTLDKDGKSIAGELIQSGFNMPFKLTRTGEAKIEKPVVNPPISKELEGTWEGTLDANGTLLRLRFVLKNETGAATGVLFSLDQGNSEIPVGRITEAGAKVKMEVPVVSGAFEGERKDSQMVGTWSQGGGTLPLTLSKGAK
jgi:hypothetical protein